MISDPHLHLMMNHLPVIGIPLVLLFAIAAGILRNRVLVRASFIMTALLSLSTFLVLETGEGAHDAMKSLSPIAHDYVEAHETVAEKVIWVVALAGSVGLAGFFTSFRTGDAPSALFFALLVSLLISSLGLAWVANLGGQISHPEIRGELPDVPGFGKEPGAGGPVKEKQDEIGNVHDHDHDHQDDHSH